ncbi:MAG TPA: hypothetical protein VF605_10930 [Allosphingosinicella sp.]|jgi:hypothetical protein
MKRYLAISGLAAVSMLLPACATVTRGTSQKYVIESTPAEAQVALSTGQTCVTPCKLKLKRKRGFTATFNKAGYEPLEAQVKSKFSGGGAAAGAGNILAGGIIGAVVDGSNGSMNNLTPNPLQVTLVPVGGMAAEPSDSPVAAADAPAPEAAVAAADPQL